MPIATTSRAPTTMSSLRAVVVVIGLVAIDLVLAFQSFRGQLVHPGEDQRERKAEHQQPEHEARCPVGQLQDVKQKLADLQDHPGGDQVQKRNAEDVAPLELGDQGHRGVLVPIVAARMHCAGPKSTRTRGAAATWVTRAQAALIARSPSHRPKAASPRQSSASDPGSGTRTRDVITPSQAPELGGCAWIEMQLLDAGD